MRRIKSDRREVQLSTLLSGCVFSVVHPDDLPCGNENEIGCGDQFIKTDWYGNAKQKEGRDIHTSKNIVCVNLETGGVVVLPPDTDVCEHDADFSVRE